jgi:hypothetical protein
MPNTKAGSSKEQFEENRYILVKNFLVNPLLNVVYRYALMKVQTGQVTREDKQVPGTPSLYGDTLMETIMELALPQIEQLTGRKLFPTYSYFRVYKQGDVLLPHIDRPSCEISFTICLGSDVSNMAADSDYRWPIFVDNSKNYRNFPDDAQRKAGPDEGRPVRLNPGDCMIYRGCEVRHWREAFPGNYQAQAFIHYVDQNGPYASYRFDRRPMLGASADTIKDDGPYSIFSDRPRNDRKS